MSDVRLVGTNPEDGSLVPVAVTSAGLLKTEIGKIEKIPNDVEIQGNLTITGTINGETPGGGGEPEGEFLPEPFGPDGSVLTIVNGGPAWVEPPPEPLSPQVELLTGAFDPNNKNGMFGGDYVQAPDGTNWDQFARGQAFFNAPVADSAIGRANKQGMTVTNDFTVVAAFSKILTITFVAKLRNSVNRPLTANLRGTASNENVLPVVVQDQAQVPANNGNGATVHQFSWLINRDIFNPFTVEIGFLDTLDPYLSSPAVSLQSWVLEDQGAFALRRQMETEAQLKQLRDQLAADSSEPQT